MSHFNNIFPKNTLVEQIDILRAVVEKKPVYFYSWDSYNRKHNVQLFKGTLPAFDIYHYDLHASKVIGKSLVAFSATGFVGSMVTRATVYTPDANPAGLKAHIKTWFDKEGALCIEKHPGANVKFVGSMVDFLQGKTDVVANPPQPPKTTLQNTKVRPGDMYDPGVEALWKRAKRGLEEKQLYYRSFVVQSGNQNVLHVPASREVFAVKEQHVIIRLKRCVLVSKTKIPTATFTKWRLTRSNLQSSIGPDRIEYSINGYDFSVYHPN